MRTFAIVVQCILLFLILYVQRFAYVSFGVCCAVCKFNFMFPFHFLILNIEYDWWEKLYEQL